MSYTESFYAILGVDQDASQQEIKQAYKKAALRTHPDRALPERKADAEREFKRIAEAYEILSEPSSRNRYNHFGTSSSPPPFPSSRQHSSSSSSSPSNTYFGVSPDKQPYSFQWESSYDSARRAQAQRGNGTRRPFGVDPFQLFNEMFEREFTRPMGSAGSMFGDDPAFANHQRMADTNGFGFGSVGFGGGMPSMSEMDPFASHGSNSTAATRRGEAGLPSSFGTFSSSMNGSMKGSNFQSESRSTRTINGRTETVVRKVDGQGNETIHTVTPEGQRVHVNGIEQPSLHLLQSQSQGTGQAALPAPSQRRPY